MGRDSGRSLQTRRSCPAPTERWIVSGAYTVSIKNGQQEICVSCGKFGCN